MDYAWAVLTLGIYDNWQIAQGQQECHYSCSAACNRMLKILQTRWHIGEHYGQKEGTIQK